MLLDKTTNFYFDDKDMRAWQKKNISQEFYSMLESTCHSCKTYITEKNDLRLLKCDCRFCIECLKSKCISMGIDNGLTEGMLLCDCRKKFDVSAVEDLIPKTKKNEQNDEQQCADVTCFKCSKNVKLRKEDPVNKKLFREIGMVDNLTKDSEATIVHLLCKECQKGLIEKIESKIKSVKNENPPIKINCKICFYEHTVFYKDWLKFSREIYEGEPRTNREKSPERKNVESFILKTCFMCTLEIRKINDPENKTSEYAVMHMTNRDSEVKHFICISCYIKVKNQVKKVVGNEKSNLVGQNLKIPCEFCRIEHTCSYEEWLNVSKVMKGAGGCCAVF